MRNPDPQLIKIALCGSAKCGKTLFFNSLMNKNSNEGHQKTAVFLEYGQKEIMLNSKQTIFEFWDCASNLKFARNVEPYYSKAEVILLCIDLSNQESFKDAKTKLENREYMTADATIILTGLKSDLDRAVSPEEFETLASNNNLRHMSVSAKADPNTSIESTLVSNISTIFDPLSKDLKKAINAYKTTREQNSREHMNFFHLGYSKTQKIAAATALIRYLHSPTITSIDTQHIKALKEGSLGNTIRAILREHHLNPATLEGLITHLNEKQNRTPPVATAASARM